VHIEKHRKYVAVMTANKNLINQENIGNNSIDNNPKGEINTDIQSIAVNGDPVIDKLWMQHFAFALHDANIFDDEQYKKLLTLIDIDIARKYKTNGKS
jgi:hypothetical protein